MLRFTVRSRILLASAILAIPNFSTAAEINWNVVSGDFNNPANWFGGVMPGVADAASINNGGSATISASPASAVFELWVGSNTPQASTATGTAGTLTQTAGTVEVLGWTVIGRSFANTGPITLPSTYNISGGVLNTDQIEMGQSFGAGVSPATGNLNISGTAVVTARNYLRVGHGDFGSYGGVGNVVVKDNAVLNVGGGAAPDFVALGFNGFNQGNKGTMVIQDNAHVNLKMPLRIGWVEEGHGEVTMSGNTLLDIDAGEDAPAGFMLGDFNNGANTSPDNRPTGIFTQSGGVTNAGNADRRPSWMAVGGSGKGTLTVSGGSFNAWVLNGLNVGDTDQNGFAGEGAVNLSGTGALNATELWFGKIGRATGTMNQTGGSVTVGIGAFIDRVATGAGGGPALNPEDNAITLGGLNIGVAPALEATAVGTYNISGGTVHAAKIIVGNAATGVWNQSGGAVTVDGELSIARVVNDYGNASNGTVNLNGGTMAVGSLVGGAGNSTLNLNGGVLKPVADNATFITGVDTIVAGAGGAKFDTSGFTIATDQQITGAGSLTKLSAGTLSLSAALVHNGGTKIDGGSLRLTGAAQTSALTAPGDIDIRNGKVVLDYTGGSSPEAQVVTILTTGYNQATKFSSGKLKNSTASLTEGLGWVTNTANSTVTVGAALYGDTDLSGTVNFDDLLSLAQNYGATGTGTWAKGDANYDKNVNFDDLLSLAQNYGGSLSLGGDAVISTGVSQSFAIDFALALSLVPEPTSLLGAFALTGIARRRRI